LGNARKTNLFQNPVSANLRFDEKGLGETGQARLPPKSMAAFSKSGILKKPGILKKQRKAVVCPNKALYL
jgi:hypothetical protein